MMEKKITRVRGNKFVTLELRLKDGELSICGIVGTTDRRNGSEFAGTHEGKRLWGHSWGQCVDAIVDFFPEMKPYMKWHLNHMHAECSHQRARGETWLTHSMAECPDCGYKLGSKWLKEELPAEVVDFINGLNK